MPSFSVAPQGARKTAEMKCIIAALRLLYHTFPFCATLSFSIPPKHYSYPRLGLVPYNREQRMEEMPMTIQPIGSASVALYITPADLAERGLTPEDLTLEEALELTRTAFRQAGIRLEGSIEI